MSPILFKNYLGSISSLLNSNTEIDPATLKIMVDNLCTGQYSIFFKYYTVFTECMNNAKKIKAVFEKSNSDLTEGDKIIKASFTKFLKFLMFKLEQ
jgi:hypothetical protein